jgi:hypothetical protein
MQLKYGPYSPSRIDVATCPYSFYRSYVEKNIDTEKDVPANRGSVVHEIFEMITKGWIEDRPLKWDDVRKILPKLMAKYQMTDHDAQQEIAKDAQCYLENPPSEIEDIVGTEEGLALKMVECEDGIEKFEECDWEDQNCFARGKIDILKIKDETATIIDHKTQQYIPTNLGTFQMGVYAWLVTQFYPFVREVKTVLHFCDYKRNFYSKPYTWTLKDLEGIKNEFMLSVETIENITNFETTTSGGHCVYCAVKRECPRILDLIKKNSSNKKTPILNAQDAVNRASTLYTLDVNKSVYQSELKDFIGEIGPVDIGGIEYSYKKSDSWDVPYENKKELFNILNSLGVDVWKYLNFDMKNLEKNIWKVVKKNDLEQIKTLLEPVYKTRFGARKA